jgi:hypothetical protein
MCPFWLLLWVAGVAVIQPPHILGTACAFTFATLDGESARLHVPRNLMKRQSNRGVAQPGSASALGAEGRVFESHRPDQYVKRLQASCGRPFLLGERWGGSYARS